MLNVYENVNNADFDPLTFTAPDFVDTMARPELTFPQNLVQFGQKTSE